MKENAKDSLNWLRSVQDWTRKRSKMKNIRECLKEKSEKMRLIERLKELD